MTPIEIIEKIKTCQQALTRGNTELKTLGIKKAKSEHDYKVALRKEMLKLRNIDKYPSNMINDLSKGNDKVAELRLKRDIAESSYYTAISAMDNLRLEIETLRSLLTWLRTELKNT
ncbi:hypothetical protein P9J83_15840 [Clostridium sporogenes]|uniref:Uncharacterized protein n=1 Tax=Clostridium sporogenes TaxID=1509 RepID=A0AAE4JU97_CLOSG|nr:hypothetical protein [Clostridium sporogenes]MDS1004956.1 hypothetical protein [Clostridium sporogenes]